jgi:hypothetical protein
LNILAELVFQKQGTNLDPPRPSYSGFKFELTNMKNLRKGDFVPVAAIVVSTGEAENAELHPGSGTA